MTTNTVVSLANRAHDVIMEIFYDDIFSLSDGAPSIILDAANAVTDPVGDQLTEDEIRSTIDGLISSLHDISDVRYREGIEKLRKLL